MNEPVEIYDDVGVKVADSLGRKLSAYFFNSVNMVETIVFIKFLLEKLSLLVKVIGKNFFHKGLNFLFFGLNHIIERHLHPHEHCVDVSALFLNSKVLFSVQKVVLLIEFAPQLFAPLRQYAKNCWAFDAEVAFFKFFLVVGRNIFADFSANYKVRVIFDLFCVLLIDDDILIDLCF